jgi:hypothetical protein
MFEQTCCNVFVFITLVVIMFLVILFNFKKYSMPRRYYPTDTIRR